MEKESFKEIIYLDEITLSSTLAQLEGGLKQSLVATETNDEQTTSGSKISGDLDMEGSIKIAKAAVGINSENSSELSRTDSIGQAMNVVFKDYQLERLISKLGKSLVSGSEAKEGDFVSIEGDFKLIDFSAIKNILNGNSLKNIMKLVPSPNGGTNWDKETEKSFKTLEALSELGTKMVPNDTLVLLNNAVIYATNNNFRTSQGQLSAINGTSRKMNVIGILESFAGSEKNDLDHLTTLFNNQHFDELGGLVTSFSESILTGLNIIKKGNQLIKPIAIYFEN